MMKLLSTFVASTLLATSAQAVTLDFSSGVYSTATDSFFFSDVASIGASDVNLRVTTGGFVTGNDANNKVNGADSFQVNLRTQPNNSATLLFELIDDSNAAVALSNLTIGVYDIDFVGQEFVQVNTPVTYTTTTATTLGTTSTGSDVTIFGSATSNVPNPSDLTALTTDQQNAAVQLTFGSVSSWSITVGLTGTAPDLTSGRNYFFGNFSFTDPTTTTTVTPVPLPAGLPLLLAGLGGIALLRRRAT